MIDAGETAVASDFINRAQANATPANDAGRVVKLEADGKIDPFFLKVGVKALTLQQPVDGSGTPKALFIDPSGHLLIADANDNDLDEFHGFIDEDHSGLTPATFLNGNDYYNGGGNVSGSSFTLSAGTDRVLYVSIYLANNGGGITGHPTTVSFNGHAMTKVAECTLSSSVSLTVWRWIAGTSGSGETGSINYSGQTSGGHSSFMCADAYQYVDQTTPELVTPVVSSSVGTTSSLATSITPTAAYNLFLHGIASAHANPITLDSRIGQRHTPAGSAYPSLRYGDGYIARSGLKTITSTYSSTSNATKAFVIVLKNSVSAAAQLRYADIQGGFSGLTPGAKYYLSNTAGEISTTPGATSIYLGKALSATELLIIQS